MHAARQRHGASTWAIAIAFTAVATSAARDARADDPTLETRDAVRGREIVDVEIDGGKTAWNAIEQPRAPGNAELVWRVHVEPGENAIELPSCARRGVVTRDGVVVSAPDAGPLVLPLSAGEHVLSARLTIGEYERRIACGAPARVGAVAQVHEGLLRLSFTSPHASATSWSGGRAVVFVPPGHDVSKASSLLVLAHPWNGSIWTYAAYAELLDEATKRDVVLLFPSGLGNSLYTAAAEDEVMLALAALASRVAIDATRVSIAGASMGGAGATTIGFHRPDAFASITSFFGDSKYDVTTYVRSLLRDEAGAHAVNAADVADNARWVPVWLVHGEDDRVSPIAQSEILARALAARGIAVRFDRVAGMGHQGALFARFARELVARASEVRAVAHPSRVTYRTVRAGDRCAYGVCVERAHAGDAFVDVERASDGVVRVNHAENVRAITLAPGALGTTYATEVTIDPSAGAAR